MCDHGPESMQEVCDVDVCSVCYLDDMMSTPVSELSRGRGIVEDMSQMVLGHSGLMVDRRSYSGFVYWSPESGFRR